MTLTPIPAEYYPVGLQVRTEPAAPAPAAAPQPSNHWIELMKPAAELAAAIARTEFVPDQYRGKPEQITACILYGDELGIGPMQSLAKIDIVKGRPAPRAELGRALAFAAGHELWVEDQTNTKVTVAGRRRGSNHTQSVTWTMDDAKKAGIASNPTYAKYPRQMLLARASAELVRAMCPEVLAGIAVFAEEAEDLEPAAPTITATTGEPDKPKTNTRKRRDPKPEPATEPTTDPTEPAATAGPSEAQTKMAMASFADNGLADRDDRLAATSAFVGHPIGSWSDLTRDEASKVIDGLEQLKAGAIAFEISTDGTWAVTAGRDELFGDD